MSEFAGYELLPSTYIIPSNILFFFSSFLSLASFSLMVWICSYLIVEAFRSTIPSPCSRPEGAGNIDMAQNVLSAFGTLSCVLRQTRLCLSHSIALRRGCARGRASNQCHLIQEPERTAWWSTQGIDVLFFPPLSKKPFLSFASFKRTMTLYRKGRLTHLAGP